MPETYRVKITEQAQGQMAEIVDYISRELCAPEAALSLLDKMEEAITALSEFPERNRLIDEEPWHSEGIRKIIVKNFFIYYWIDQAAKKVQVTAVIYMKRDQIRQLKKMILDDSI